MKTLIMVASRNRPRKLSEMLASFNATKLSSTEIAIYVADNDPCLEEYREILKPYIHKIGKWITQGDVFNLFSSEFKNVEFYGTINDDHIYHTKEWDKSLTGAIASQGNGWGLACANDLLTDWNKFKHPGATIISGNIVRTLGYYTWPKFRWIGIDFAQGALFTKLNRLYYLPEVIVEHRHWLNSKAKKDDNYRWIYGEEEQTYGHRLEEEYLRSQLNIEYNLIIKAIGGTNETVISKK